MKEITIALDKQRAICFNINAMIELEERFDKPLPEIFDSKKVTLGLMRALARIGLKHGGMEIEGATIAEQEEYVGELIQEHWIKENKDFQELMVKISEAFADAGIFTPSEKASKQPTKKAKGTDK